MNTENALMIPKDVYDARLHQQMARLSLRMTGDPSAQIITPAFSGGMWVPSLDLDEAETSVWYLGDGRWRARVTRFSKTGVVIRTRLLNSGEQQSDIVTVETAMSILGVLPGTFLCR